MKSRGQGSRSPRAHPYQPIKNPTGTARAEPSKNPDRTRRSEAMMSVSRIPRCARSIPEATTDAGLGICRPVRDIAHQTPMPRNTVAMFSVRMAGGRRRFVDSLRDGVVIVAVEAAPTGCCTGVGDGFGEGAG